MTDEEQLQAYMDDLRDIILKFKIVGVGVSGNFEDGYDVQEPEIEVDQVEGVSGV